MNCLETITLTNIDEIVTIKANKGKHVTVKQRRYFGLSFCKSGKITYTHNGRKYISNTNCAIIHPMNATYELYNNEGGEFPVINFHCANDELTDEFICIPISNVNTYLSDFERLRALSYLSSNRAACMGMLYGMFHRLITEENGDRILFPVLNYMNDHFCEQDITNSLLAKKANISEVYLRQLFKEKYNSTPRQYLISMRIEKAKQMLVETQGSVNDIGIFCGFSSIYHFSRAFKNKLGMTPSEYRKNYYTEYL